MLITLHCFDSAVTRFIIEPSVIYRPVSLTEPVRPRESARVRRATRAGRRHYVCG